MVFYDLVGLPGMIGHRSETVTGSLVVLLEL